MNVIRLANQNYAAANIQQCGAPFLSPPLHPPALRRFVGYNPCYCWFSFFLCKDSQPPEIESSDEDIISLETRDPITTRVGAEVSALTGTKVSLQCSATGVPSPRVVWSKLERGELQSLLGLADSSSSTLVISNSTVGDNGLYQCTAISQIGVGTQETKLTFFGKLFWFVLFTCFWFWFARLFVLATDLKTPGKSTSIIWVSFLVNLTKIACSCFFVFVIDDLFVAL